AGTLVTANAASTYLFADGVHPTAAGHRAIADLVISELAAPQQMSVLPEAPLIFTGNATLAINTELARRSESSVEGVHLFASGGYTNGKSDGQMIDIPQTDSDGLMVTGGASLTMSNGTTAGLALTLGRTRSSWGDHGGFDTDAAMLTAFGQYGGGDGLYINAQGRVMDLGYNVERTFNLGPLVRTETSNPNGWGAGARLGAGYWFGMGGAMTGPFVSVDYQRISVDGFAEHGSDSSAMTFSEQTRDALVGEVGWAVKGSMQGGGGVWQPFASIAYGYDAKADRQYLTAGLVTLNGDFQMLGYEPEKQWISASAGVSANFGGSWAGHVAYSGRFADEGRQAHGIVVGLSTAF
ncbi:MAG: autotransporter outer membrane beta-barrel domain-containing protein, partial [Caulobacteraceae bacterium]